MNASFCGNFVILQNFLKKTRALDSKKISLRLFAINDGIPDSWFLSVSKCYDSSINSIENGDCSLNSNLLKFLKCGQNSYIREQRKSVFFFVQIRMTKSENVWIFTNSTNYIAMEEVGTRGSQIHHVLVDHWNPDVGCVHTVLSYNTLLDVLLPWKIFHL